MCGPFDEPDLWPGEVCDPVPPDLGEVIELAEFRAVDADEECSREAWEAEFDDAA